MKESLVDPSTQRYALLIFANCHCFVTHFVGERIAGVIRSTASF